MLHTIAVAQRSILFFLAIVLATMSTAHTEPSIVVESGTIHLGTLSGGMVTESRVVLVNAGDAPLQIKAVQTSCSCVSIEAPDEAHATIAPAGELVLPFTYDTAGRYGAIAAQILIVSDDPEHPFTHINITGSIDVALRAEPAAGIEWTALRGSAIAESVRIWPGAPERPFVFVGAEVTGTSVAVTSAPVKENGLDGVELSFMLPDTLDPREYNTQVSVLVTVEGKDEVFQVPFAGTVLGDQDLSPRQIVSSRMPRKPGDFLGRVVVQSNRAGECIEVIDLQTTVPIRAELVSDDTTLDEWVYVYAAHTAPGPEQEGTVYLGTTSEDEPSVAVPVSFQPAPPLMAEPNGIQVRLEPGQIFSHDIEFTNVYRQPIAIAETRVEVTPPLPADAAGVDETEGPVATETKAEAPSEEIPVHLLDSLAAVARIYQEVLSTMPETLADQPAVVALTLTGAPEAREQRERVIVTTNIPGFEMIEIPIAIMTILPEAPVATEQVVPDPAEQEK